MRLVVPFLLSIIFAACATKAQRLQVASPSLSPDASFYVPLCVDGQQDGHRQVASGLMTSQLLGAELKAHAHRVELGAQEESHQLALGSARERDFKYVAFASILDWQDEATPMASVPDKVRVRIDIVDVASASLVDSVILQNQTSEMAATKIPPQDLLVLPLKEYIEVLIHSDSQAPKQTFWERLLSWFF